MPVAKHISMCTLLPVTLIGVAYANQPEKGALNIESRDWHEPHSILRSMSCSTEVSGVSEAPFLREEHCPSHIKCIVAS